MWGVFNSVVINPNMKNGSCFMDHAVNFNNGQLFLGMFLFKVDSAFCQTFNTDTDGLNMQNVFSRCKIFYMFV